MGLIRFVVIRVLWALPTVLLVCVGVFALIRAIPGDPAVLMLGEGASAEAVARVQVRLGLDQPVPVQFARWLGAAATGDLGQSIRSQQAVGPLLIERFRVTATIVLVAVGVASLIAVPLGLVAAWRQHSTADLLIVAVATVMLAVPSFWLGLLLLLVFGLWLGWFPVIGYVSFAEDWTRALLSIALPVAALVLSETGAVIRMMRASTLDVLRLDYITHARAKGAGEGRVLLVHVLPNAFAPTLTLIALVLGSLLGGSAVVETVFTIPGLGRLLIDALDARDYPVIQGCLLFIALIYVGINLAVDLLYPLFDPRVAAA